MVHAGDMHTAIARTRRPTDPEGVSAAVADVEKRKAEARAKKEGK